MTHIFEQPSQDCVTASTRRRRRFERSTSSYSIVPMLLAGLVIVAASCADSPTGESAAVAPAPRTEANAAAPSPGQTPHVSTPLDLAGVMRRVHFSFRPDGAAFSGGHTSYEVRAFAHGFSVTPGRTDVPRDPNTHELPSEALGAPATFETVSVGRGAELHDAQYGEPRVAEDGHLVLPRGDIEEHLENTDDGVEQRYSFAKRPEGQGDLVIRVRVSGEDYAGETEHGHHFVDMATGIGLRYGLATWIDAKGERTALRVDYIDEAGALELVVPEAVIDGSAYPAVLDPVVSPEFGMGEPIQGYVNDTQSSPELAFDGTNYLVAWRDARFMGSHVYAALVSSAGVLLSPGGLELGSCSAATIVGVAFNGSRYVVVWTAATTNYATRRTVSPTGTLIGSEALLDGTAAGYRPRIASDGATFLVVHDTNSDVRATRLTSLGGAASTFSVSTASGNQSNAAVAFDGTNYLVAWADYRNGSASDIYATRITPAGTNLHPTGFAVSTAAQNQSSPRIAFDGLNSLVIWEENKWGNPDIYGARVDNTGLVLDPLGIEIVKVDGIQNLPAVAFNGTRYIVTWTDERGGDKQIYATRMLPDSTVLDTGGFLVTSEAANHSRPAVACSPASCLTVFEDSRFVSPDIWGARIDSTGMVLDTDGFAISSTGNEQKTPAVAWGDGQYLAVWEDKRIALYGIYGTRIDSDGSILDPDGIGISIAAGVQEVTPAVSWNGSNFVVVWARNGSSYDIYGARVQADGTVLDAAGVPICAAAANQTMPAIDFDGTNHLVVWQDYRSSNWNIYGARVSPTMSVLDPTGFVIEGTTTSGTRPKLAFDGTQYLVVWESARANRVTPAGSVLDGNGFALSSGMTNPVVAYDGLNFFVAGGVGNVVGQRITSTGFIIDAVAFAIANANPTEDQATIVRDGEGVFVAWRDARHSSSERAIYGTWVSQAGDRSHPLGLAISHIAGSSHVVPSVAADNAGHVLVAYERPDLSGPSKGHDRVYARLITALAPGQACTQAAECANGFCVDGVCCNTACGSGNPNDCLACSMAAGATADGSCTALNAIPCSDGNGCTDGDMCMAGTCMAGGPKDCPAQNSCQLNGTCNQATGECTYQTVPNGTMCDDGDACTIGDACQSGACVPASLKACTPLDSCHDAGTCDPGTGQCSNPVKQDGASCNDNNACTQMETCQAGTCTGGTAVVCTAMDQCHDAGTCDPMTGQCSNPAKPNGSMCNDGSACSQTDTCQAGVCTGGNPVICMPQNDCHTAGTCDPATGQCSSVPKAEGSGCNDGDQCTVSDSCIAGTCTAGAVKVCTPLNECHTAGTCNPANGMCSNPKVPDGTPCSGGGMCVDGTCTGASSSSSSSSSSGAGGEGGAGGAGGGQSSSSSSSSGQASSSSSSGQASSSTSGGGAGGDGQSSSGVGGDMGEGGSGGSSTDRPIDSSGCGCRTANSTPSTVPMAAIAFGAGLLLRRRRRSSAN